MHHARCVVSIATWSLLASGCVAIPLSRQRGGPELTPKPIASKEAPASLVARDGSRCLVDAVKYAQARVGEEAWCVWTDADERDAPGIGKERTSLTRPEIARPSRTRKPPS